MTRAFPVVLSALLGLISPGCAGAQTPPPVERDERLAALLAEGASAHSTNDMPMLARVLGQIDRLGAHPAAEATGPDPVAVWRSRVAPGMAPTRGSPLGPGYRSGQIGAGRADRFDQVFLSGRKAKIALSAPGNAPVALRVFDAGAKAVCANPSSRACHWVPVYTQRYTIEVVNPGPREADYFLVVD